METAEQWEPYESRGSRTVLGEPGGESPPGHSTKDDLIALKFDFRFTTGSGLKWDVAACLKGAMNRLMHRSKNKRNFDQSCGASNAAVDLAAQRPEVDRFG